MAPKTIFKCCSVRWSKPQSGWWKLNTDGAARGNPGDAAAGGVIRDHMGKPLIMFSEFLGVRTNNFAELYAIWRGLELCIENHFDKVWVEVDSKIALSLIEHSTTTHWQLQSIISKIREFRGSIEIRFSHIFREGNAVADWLANHGCDRKDFFLQDVFYISVRWLDWIYYLVFLFLASSTKSSDINISLEPKSTDSSSMGYPLQKSSDKNHSVKSTEATTEGSANKKADPKNMAEHPKIQTQQVNSEDSEKENPQCKNNTGSMNPPLPSGDPKKLTDPISMAVEGSINPEVNAEFAVPNEGSIPDLVNDILKKTKISEKSFPSGLDPEKIMEIATQITEKILKYSSGVVSKGKSVENVYSGVPTSGVGGFSNPALEEGEIAGAEFSQGGSLSNPLVGGSAAIPVSTTATSMGFSAEKSAGLTSEGDNVPPTVVQPVVVGGSSGDPPPATGLSKSFLEATSAPQSDAVLGSVDFSATYPTVIFTADECELVSSCYRFAIIGKFSYGKPSNHMISQQLKTEGFGTCKVHFLNGKHVLINLSSKLLCDKLWMRREFIFAGFPMRMFRWDPFFNFKEEPAVVPLWVKIHALPPQWFDLRSLKTIASSVGEFLKADEPTHNRSRLSFARVCVEVNLKNHLPKKINLQVGEDSVPLDIEFEKVPQYCNYCKHIGHDIHKCYMKNPALKPAVFTNKNFNAQQGPTAAPNGNLKITLPHQATASGEVSANHDDAFQTVGKGFKPNRSFPPPKITLVSNVVSNPFDILSQNEELCDGLNLEASTSEPCPLDKDPVASLLNLGHTNPSPVLPASHGPLNNFDQEELIGVVILEGSTDNTNIFFTQDPGTFQNLGSDQVGTSKTKVMDNQAYYSADELEGFDNYNSDGSVQSGKSLPDQPFPDHAPVSKVVGTEMILFKNKHNNPAPLSIMIIVYGRNTKIQRRDLWDDLLSVSQNQVPWMVGGDFNIILQLEEKKGGACPIQSDMEEFSDCLLNCNLSDVGFAGTPFTWYRDGVWQRLDRILVSPEWYSSFPSMSTRHLPKYQSDHNSLLCQFDQNIAIRRTSFRFQNMWVKHHLFLPTVQESWGIHTFSRGMFKLSEKLVRLKYTLKEWNTHHFGNIFNKIDQAQYAVEIAEKDFDYDPSTSNRSYLNKMNANLTLTLSMEEDFWKQKANMKWMLEGERNSKFFHNLVKKKRQKIFLHCIRDNGCLITNPEDIQVSAVNYFSNCFAEQMPILDELDPNLVPKIITHDQNNMLCFTPTIDEIRNCVFDMEVDSVAGPDGFGIKFFQSCWDIISSDVFDAVVDFFSGSPMPRAFTTTTISLIPKNNNPQSWKDFRPISLCNSTYKIISKILSKRLATILPSFINSAQSGFIKGRNITDNILTAHEVTHDISQSMTNTIIKLDMEKAYDRINWNFIFQVMTRFGFSVVWVNFIKSCISNCWFSILVNGQSSGFFKSDRGIRQGDPLSPLIFAIAADYFSRSIDKMFDRNPTMFYKIKKNVKITHLAYADDILIFLNATKKNLHLLNNCLTHYENVSGQKVNNFKSNFIMYKPTPQVANWVQRISGFKNATLPVMYLGVPLWKGFQSFEMGIYATNFCYCWNDRRVDNVPFTANRVCERIWNYINTFNHKVNFKNKKFWIGAARIADRVGVPAAPKTFFKCCSVRWSKPQPGWWKLNTDGAARGNPGAAAAGGIIRDHMGKPLIMFSEYLGVHTNNFAELYAIWRGLEFCIDNHFNKVWVEVDSKIALSLIEHSTTSHWQLQSIISKIRDFRDSIEIRFSHIFREGNAVADWLANHGCDRKDFYLHDVFSINGKLLGLTKLDKMSYPYIRSKKTFIS
ncbi:hypothetical protein OROMI_013299 [Orobanche minor]